MLLVVVLFSTLVFTDTDPLSTRANLYPLFAKISLTASVSTYYIDSSVGNGFFSFGEANMVWNFKTLYASLPTRSSITSTSFSALVDVSGLPPTLCTKQHWTSPGTATVTPAYLWNNASFALNQFSGYADEVGYVDFQTPQLRLTIEGFERESNRSDCTYTSDDRVDTTTQFSNLIMCDAEMTCALGMEDSYDIEQTWLVLSEHMKVELDASWYAWGTRILLQIDAASYFGVPGLLRVGKTVRFAHLVSCAQCLRAYLHHKSMLAGRRRTR
jgi:hypothetical protein